MQFLVVLEPTLDMASQKKIEEAHSYYGPMVWNNIIWCGTITWSIHFEVLQGLT